jgi:hypothetical protein
MKKKYTVKDFTIFLEKQNQKKPDILLKFFTGFNSYFKGEYEYIENVTNDYLCQNFRNFGIKKKLLFDIQKEKFMSYIHSLESGLVNETDNLFSTIPREKYTCKLRADLLKTLKTIEDQTRFIEFALLEKFEREKIKLLKYNE